MIGRSFPLALLALVVGCFDDPGADSGDGAEATASSTGDSATGVGTSSPATGGGTAVVDDGTTGTPEPTDTGATDPTEGGSSTGEPPPPLCICPMDADFCDDFDEFDERTMEFKGWGDQGATSLTQVMPGQCGDSAMGISVPAGDMFTVAARNVGTTPQLVSATGRTFIDIGGCPGVDDMPIRLAQLRLDAANRQSRAQLELRLTPQGDAFTLYAQYGGTMATADREIPRGAGPWYFIEIEIDTSDDPAVARLRVDREEVTLNLAGFTSDPPVIDAQWVLGPTELGGFDQACTAVFDLASLSVAP